MNHLNFCLKLRPYTKGQEWLTVCPITRAPSVWGSAAQAGEVPYPVLCSPRKNDMSRQRNDDSLTILGCIFLLFILPLIWIWEMFQTPVIEQVRRLNRQPYWGNAIEAFPCPICQTANEPDRDFCFFCGQPLTFNAIGTSNRSYQRTSSDNYIILTLILVFIALIILCTAIS